MLDHDGNYINTWHLPNNITVSENYRIFEYPNGTISLVTNVDDYSWRVLTSPLEKPVKYGKKLLS
jgi:hypothetical protein